MLGAMYNEGQIVPEDKGKALTWFRKAAEQGHAEAQYNLGSHYYEGEAVPQNYAEAVKWFTQAAEQGDADAQHALANCYYEGKGTPQAPRISTGQPASS